MTQSACQHSLAPTGQLSVQLTATSCGACIPREAVAGHQQLGFAEASCKGVPATGLDHLHTSQITVQLEVCHTAAMSGSSSLSEGTKRCEGGPSPGSRGVRIRGVRALAGGGRPRFRTGTAAGRPPGVPGPRGPACRRTGPFQPHVMSQYQAFPMMYVLLGPEIRQDLGMRATGGVCRVEPRTGVGRLGMLHDGQASEGRRRGISAASGADLIGRRRLRVPSAHWRGAAARTKVAAGAPVPGPST